jgi:hypothetical protein
MAPAEIPGGDAMSARFHRDAELAQLKRTKVRRPRAWRIHPDDIVRFAAEGQHCQTRRCHDPVAIVTWRFWRSTEARRVLLAEHLVCERHGQEFAGRHHIEIEPHPGDEP